MPPTPSGTFPGKRYNDEKGVPATFTDSSKSSTTNQKLKKSAEKEMKTMGKKTFSNLQQVKSLEGNRKLHILFPTMLLLLSWVIFSVTCVVNAAEYDASDVDKPPKLVRSMEAKYPPEAKRHKTGGRVVVRCLITAQGKADKLEVVESEPAGVFDESALKAIKYYQFRPGVLKGEMVDTWVKIPLTFEP